MFARPTFSFEFIPPFSPSKTQDKKSLRMKSKSKRDHNLKLARRYLERAIKIHIGKLDESEVDMLKLLTL